MLARMFNKVSGQWVDTDPHQIEAYDHLVLHDRAGLFLGMSLSKSVVALTYLHDMHYKELAIKKTLVIAPGKVSKITWPDELNKWQHLEGMNYKVIAGDAPKRLKALACAADIDIVSVDNLDWLLSQFVYMNRSRRWVGELPYDCVVIDESSLFKNEKSNRFKKLKRAIKTVKYRYIMTGTPSPNGYIDLWAPLYLLDEGERLEESRAQFVHKYFTTRGNGMVVYEYIPRPGAIKEIARRISDICLTMQTDDYLKLPTLWPIDYVLEFDAFDAELYKMLEEEMFLEFDTGTEVTIKTAADLTNKLLQVSSGAIYEDRGIETARVWHQVNNVKIEALRQLFEQYPDEKFILVYQFRHEIDRIRAAFPFVRQFREGVGLVEDFKDWNAGKIKALLIHPAGAGHGLNLQFGGFTMVWLTPTYNVEHYQQTIARLKRRGQVHEMYIYRFIIKGTRDIKVVRKLESKESDQTFLFNEVKELRKKYGKQSRY